MSGIGIAGISIGLTPQGCGGGGGGRIGIDVDFAAAITGANNALITAAMLNAGNIGPRAADFVWTLEDHNPAQHTRIAALAADYVRRVALKVAGVSYDGSGLKLTKFDLAEALSNGSTPLYESQVLTAPAGIADGVTLTVIELFGALNGSAGNTYDTYVLYTGGGYVALQYALDTSGLGVFRVEGQVSGVTQRGQYIPIPSRTVPYRADARANVALQRGEICLIDNATNTLVGVSECDSDCGDMTNLRRQDYLLQDTGGGGALTHGILGLKWGAPSFPLGSPTLPAPTSIVGIQSAVNTVTVTWVSVAQRFKIEHSSDSGANWTTIVSNFDDSGGVRSFDDTGLTNGMTYIYRISALVGDLAPALSNSSSPVTIDNSPFTATPLFLTVDAPFNLEGPADVEIGTGVTPTTNETIRSVGVFRVGGGSHGTHAIRIYAADRTTILATGTADTSTVADGEWAYGTLNVAVSALAGVEIFATATYTAASGEFYLAPGMTLTATPGWTYEAVYVSGGVVVSYTTTSYGPINIKFS